MPPGSKPHRWSRRPCRRTSPAEGTRCCSRSRRQRAVRTCRMWIRRSCNQSTLRSCRKLQKASPSHGLLTEHACCTRAVEEDPDERRARGVVEMGANQGSPHVAAAFVGMRQKSRETMMSGIVRIGGVCCFGRALAFFFLIVAITTLRTVSQL